MVRFERGQVGETKQDKIGKTKYDEKDIRQNSVRKTK